MAEFHGTSLKGAFVSMHILKNVWICTFPKSSVTSFSLILIVANFSLLCLQYKLISSYMEFFSSVYHCFSLLVFILFPYSKHRQYNYQVLILVILLKCVRYFVSWYISAMVYRHTYIIFPVPILVNFPKYDIWNL